MKAAGVSYTLGREARGKYNESSRADRTSSPAAIRSACLSLHTTKTASSCLTFSRRKSWLVSVTPTASSSRTATGCASLLIRRIAGRFRPANYDRSRYGLVLNFLKAAGDGAQMGDFLGISPMPNSKTDINAAMISTNLPGASWEYPEASYERRREIEQEHLTWAQGLLYLLANDDAVPQRLPNGNEQMGADQG